MILVGDRNALKSYEARHLKKSFNGSNLVHNWVLGCPNGKHVK